MPTYTKINANITPTLLMDAFQRQGNTPYIIHSRIGEPPGWMEITTDLAEAVVDQAIAGQGALAGVTLDDATITALANAEDTPGAGQVATLTWTGTRGYRVLGPSGLVASGESSDGLAFSSAAVGVYQVEVSSGWETALFNVEVQSA